MPNPGKDYLVVECPNCHRFILAVSDKKTRTCPYCGKRAKLEFARVAARSKSAPEARQALQKLKSTSSMTR